MPYKLSFNYKILLINILFIVTLLLAPIGFYTVRTSLFLEIIISWIILYVLIYEKIKFDKVTYNFTVIIILFILSSIPLFVKGSSELGIFEVIKLSRNILLPFIYAIFLFIFVKKFTINQKLKIFYLIIFIISIDAYFSSIMYHTFFFRQPELLYPWSFINLKEENIVINFNDIPTLFAYPYLHSEVFLFGVVSLYILALKWNNLILINLFLVHALFQVSTAILGVLIVFFIYYSFKRITYVFLFLAIVLLLIYLLWDFIEPVLIFYDYFSSDIFINILGLDKIYSYFHEVTILNQLFGTFSPMIISQESAYGTEIGYFRIQMKFGIVFFIFVCCIFFFVSIISFKRYKTSNENKYLIYSLIPIYIFIDGVHYFNFFKIQTTYICVLIFLLMVSDKIKKEAVK